MNMSSKIRSFIAAIVFGWTSVAQASLIQEFYFFFGEPLPDLSNNDGIVQFVFPRQTGCVSGPDLLGGGIDCGGMDTDAPGDIKITGAIIGEGEFSAGFWDIDSSGFLAGELAFVTPLDPATEADDILTNMVIDGPLFPDDTAPVGRRGTFTVINPAFPDLPPGSVVAAPVPTPSVAALFGVGLLVLGLIRRP